MIKSVSLVFGMISCLSAHALTVDNMFIISDESGNGVVTLTNDLDKPSFIKTSINEIETDGKGEIVRVPYTKENIQQWRVMTTAPKLILEPGRIKDVGIRSLCYKVKCDSNKDMTFSVTFEPSPYLKPGEERDNAVQINYGYSVIYVVPAKKSDMKYNITRSGKTLKIFNHGNTMLTFLIDNCNVNKVAECRVQQRVIAGRVRQFELPDHMESINLDATIFNHNERYKRKVKLTPDISL